MTGDGYSLGEQRHARRWWVLVVLALAQLMVVLDATVVNIALPHAQHALGFSNNARQWVITAYSLAFGSLLLLGGRLADVYGRKRLFLTGVIGFATASAVGGASVDFPMLVAARTVQGAFGALLAPAALSLLSTTFSQADERGKAFGIYGGIAAAGSSVGLLLGGVLTQYLSWRYTMYVNDVIALAAVAGGVALLPAHAAEDREPIDRHGTLLACLSLFAIVYGFSHAATKAGSAGWSDPQTIGFLTAGVLLLGLFFLVERRVSHPLLPPRVIVDRNRGGAYAAMFLASVGLFGVFLFLTYYLETVLHYSPVTTGLAFLPMTGMVMLTAGLASSVLMYRVSPRLLVPTGLLVAAVGLICLRGIGLQSHYLTAVLPGLLMVAVGLGLVFAPCFSLGTLGVAGGDSGVASATVNVSQQIGGSIGTALLNSIATSAAVTYASAHAHAVHSAAIHSYVVAFTVSAGVFVAAAVVIAIMLRPGVVDLGANAELEPAMIHA